MDSLLGTGVFNSDGSMWKFHRSITRPFFSRERVTDFEIFTRHADHAIALLKRNTIECGEAVDIQDMAGRFTLDSATEFLFGKDVRSLDAPLPVPYDRPAAVSPESATALSTSPSDANNAFSNAFASAQRNAMFRTRLGFVWPLLEMFGDRCKDAVEVLYGYIDPILKEALDEKKKNGVLGEGTEGKVGEGTTLLSHMVALTDGMYSFCAVFAWWWLIWI